MRHSTVPLALESPEDAEIGTIRVVIPRAMRRADGRIEAEVRVVDTRDTTLQPLYVDDRVVLTNAKARERLAQAILDAAPDVDGTLLAEALLDLGLRLEARATTNAAIPTAASPTGAAPRRDVAVLEGAALALAEAPDLLDRVAALLAERGLIGERENALIVFLAAAAARLLPRPLSVIIKSPSGAGKSHLLQSVLDLLPTSAYVAYTTVTPRFIHYTEDDLRYRVFAVYEADGLDRQGMASLRSLLTEGRLKIGAAGRAGGRLALVVEKEGPTALFTTTTRLQLDPELESRALILRLCDDAEHTRAIKRGTANRYKDMMAASSSACDISAVTDLLTWLETAGKRRVSIPYADLLADELPNTLRMRRDLPKLLSLISASAILHQQQRPSPDATRIDATLEDYALVRDLIDEAFAAAQQDDLTLTMRETAAAVAELSPKHHEGVPMGVLVKRLELDKGTVSRRLDVLAHHGFVRDLEKRQGVPRRVVPGLPLPAPDGLPTVAKLTELIAAGEGGQS